MTIFGKIIRREIPADIVYEDDKCLAFRDIHPQSPTHLLLIPKKEITSMAEIRPEDSELLGYLMVKAAELAAKMGLADEGYRLVVNTKAFGGQTVYHLHIHILGGPPLIVAAGIAQKELYVKKNLYRNRCPGRRCYWRPTHHSALRIGRSISPPDSTSG